MRFNWIFGFFKDSIDTSNFSAAFNVLIEQIGKSYIQQQQHQQQQQINTGSSPAAGGSPNGANSSIFTSHQPLSIEMITSLTRHVKNQLVFSWFVIRFR